MILLLIIDDIEEDDWDEEDNDDDFYDWHGETGDFTKKYNAITSNTQQVYYDKGKKFGL